MFDFIRSLDKKRAAAVLAVLTVAGSANAAVDLAPVTGAQTDALAVAGALLSMGIAVWAANYIRRKFFN